MRTTWMLGGLVLGDLLLSAMALASPNLQFQTVINQGDSIAGDQFGDAGQVVVGADGSVGIVGLLYTSGNPIVIHSTVSGGVWSNNPVAVEGTSYNIPSLSSTEQFDGFDNLAMSSNPASGTRLTFAAEDVNSNEGIIQWDTNAPTLGDVAFDSDSNGYSNVGGNGTDSGYGLLELQVNAGGQVMFPATTTTNVIVRGDRSSLTNMYTSTLTLSNADQGSRVALGSDGSGAALLTAGSTNGIYTISAIGGITNKVSGSFTPASVDPVMGYASNGVTSETLMLLNGSASQTYQIGISQNGSSPTILVPQFTVSPGNAPPQAELTPNGKIAMYVPNTTGDTIQTGSAASTQVIASVFGTSNATASTDTALDPTGSPLKIIALTSPGETWGPEINQGGTVLFTAEVGTSVSNEKEALLDWMPGNISPEILLAAGDQVTVAGNPVTVDDFTLNTLSSDYDYYKNAINDTGDIAVAIDYTGAGNTSGSAVLYAAVPEPSTIALLCMASAGLLARRRRR